MEVIDISQDLSTGATPTFYGLNLTELTVSGTGTFENVNVTLDLDVDGTATIKRLLVGGVTED